MGRVDRALLGIDRVEPETVAAGRVLAAFLAVVDFPLLAGRQVGAEKHALGRE